VPVEKVVFYVSTFLRNLVCRCADLLQYHSPPQAVPNRDAPGACDVWDEILARDEYAADGQKSEGRVGATGWPAEHQTNHLCTHALKGSDLT
jgi:hypothetical protein